jgi:hypothetical protein
MPVPSCSRRPRMVAPAAILTLAIVAGCSQDDTVTGPGQALPPERAEALARPPSGLDVHTDAASHYADGYVWANSPTSPSYTPNTAFSFNRSGKGITITRQGVGAYTVRFAGLSALLGTKSTVRVTGYGADDSYCKPATQKLQSDVIKIKCLDGGRPIDAFYTIYVTGKFGDLAFAYASNPTGTDYAPPGSASFNPVGAIRVFRRGVGSYQVKFAGFGSKLISNGGHPQAVAIGTGGQYCLINGWGGKPDLLVTVFCFSRDGASKDVKFNVFFATPNPNLAYALVDQRSTTSSPPNSFFRFNPSGGSVTSTRVERGRYTVSWSGLALLDGGDVQVTALDAGGTRVVCKVEGWSSLFSAPTARVRCFDPATDTLLDAVFNIMYFS